MTRTQRESILNGVSSFCNQNPRNQTASMVFYFIQDYHLRLLVRERTPTIREVRQHYEQKLAKQSRTAYSY